MHAALKQMPVSLDMAGEEAKEALYEVPPAFFKLVLGKHFKFRFELEHYHINNFKSPEHNIVSVLTVILKFDFSDHRSYIPTSYCLLMPFHVFTLSQT